MSLKYSLVLAALAALATIAVIVGQSEDIVAQNQTTTTHRSITNFTKLIEDEYTPDVLKEGKREPLVKLIHEGQTTLILENVASEMGSLAEVIDIAIQNGYKLDAVTVFTEEEPSDIADYIQLNPVYTVFMSKG
jgi:hypothetical protein